MVSTKKIFYIESVLKEKLYPELLFSNEFLCALKKESKRPFIDGAWQFLSDLVNITCIIGIFIIYIYIYIFIYIKVIYRCSIGKL